MKIIIFGFLLVNGYIFANNTNIPHNLTIECEPTIIEDSNESSLANQFTEIKRLILALYNNEVFHTSIDPNFKITDICTEKFLKNLSDAYSNEYDGDGYATWLLRSGKQDGDDTPSKVLYITLGSDNTIIVHWSDMGIKGSTTFTMVKINEHWKIDNSSVPEGFKTL